jgi:hypothetical protein
MKREQGKARKEENINVARILLLYIKSFALFKII